jgi:hydroxypyruvate isomerase
MNYPISRRTALQRIGAGTVLLAGVAHTAKALDATSPSTGGARIKQSVCQWCYSKIPLEELCAAAAAMGLKSVELLQPKDFPTLAKHGLICAMVSNPTVPFGDVKVGGIERAWNRVEHHDVLVAAYETQLRATAEAGYPNLICFSGNRAGMSDAQGLENCAIGLRRILPLAEKLGVTVCMELLNSRVNHKDYMCDHSVWGVELCKKLNSPRFKLLYDIYHMQIMEGDVIATIRANHEFFAHYHTGGVPGRAEIDETQELNYPAIMRAIIETGFQGYVAQEFVPKRAVPLDSLRQSVKICDV